MKLTAIVATLLMAGGFAAPFLAPANREAATEKAIAAFRAKQFAAAAEALSAIPADEPITRFNRGTARLAAGEHDTGARDLQAVPRSHVLASAASYNLGTAALSAQKPAEAIGHLEAALRLEPGNRAAKRNLELALKQQEQQDKQERSRSGSGKGSGKNAPQQPEGKQQQPQQAQQPGQTGKQPVSDAERLLSAVQQQEKEELRRMHKANSRPVAIGW